MEKRSHKKKMRDITHLEFPQRLPNMNLGMKQGFYGRFPV